VNTEVWHTYGMIETYALQMLPALTAAHQQHRDLHFPAINRVHVPVAYLAMLLLIGVIALASRHEPLGRVRPLAVTVALALLANAFVCGALSNPHDRYGARMVWLAVLVLLLTPWAFAGSTSSRSGLKVTPSEIRRPPSI
jgi:peptidoglycan/LPS O-acetylase OafA/YrhL